MLRFFGVFITLMPLVVSAADETVLVQKATSDADRFDVTHEIETLIPKRETGVPDFLKKHPEYDGRGAVLAILDTGVDPGAPGLQETTTGERKIVDMIDASGAGDVDMTTTRTLTATGTIISLTSQTLTLPSGIENPSGLYRVGWKRGSELFTGGTMRRANTQRQRRWDQEQNARLVERAAQKEKDKAEGLRPDDSTPDADLKRPQLEYRRREKILADLEKSWPDEDPGPIYTCLLWNDGKAWRAIVDTDEDNDLADEKVLRPFGIAGEYGSFDDEVSTHFGIQVYEEGKVLSIVTETGAHGTHVAGIATANFPDDPARNGVAPGARVLSIRIGDIRIGGGSTLAGEMRAVAACAKYGVDLMNASWGGSSKFQDGSDLGCETYAKLVKDYGVIAFVSAGNNGPALSTLGSPGGECPYVIGVGAYVSEDMAKALHAVNGESGNVPYQFSSRGPAKNGDLGVDIFAPGGAIAPIAISSVSKVTFMNGTSMSSPSAAGVGALLVSAAKQLGIKPSAPRIKAALMNSAIPVPDGEVFATGAGLIQAGPAFEHLQAYKDVAALDVFMTTSCNDNELMAGTGYYMRSRIPAGERSIACSIGAEFPTVEGNQDRYKFNEDIVLEATVPWIKVPKYVNLANGSENFRPVLTIPEFDAAAPATEPLYGEIRGFLASKPDMGPLFRLPLTLLQPQVTDAAVQHREHYSLEMSQGHTVRHFITAPEGASLMRVRLSRNAEERDARTYILHAMTLVSNESFESHETQAYKRLEPGDDADTFVPVLSGRTVELCLHQLFTSLGESKLDVDVDWVGIEKGQTVVAIDENQKVASLSLRSTFADVTGDASAELDGAVYTLMPVDTEIIPTDERGEFKSVRAGEKPLRQFQLRQKFEWTLEKPVSVGVASPDGFSGISEEFGGGLLQVFSESGRLVASGSIRPGTSIPKGKNTIWREFRALDNDRLEYMKDYPLLLTRRLMDKPSLAVYASPIAAIEKRSAENITLVRGRDQEIIIGDNAIRALKDVEPTPTYFTGTFTLKKEDRELVSVPISYRRGEEWPKNGEGAPAGFGGRRRGRGGRPGPPPGAGAAAAEEPTPGEGKEKEKEKEKNVIEQLNDDIFEKRFEVLKTLTAKRGKDDVTSHTELLAKLIEERPKDPRLYIERGKAVALRGNLLGEWEGKSGSRGGRGMRGRGAMPGGPKDAKDDEAKETTGSKAKESEAKDEKDSKHEERPGRRRRGGRGRNEVKIDPAEAEKQALADFAKARELANGNEVAAFFGAKPIPGPDDKEAKDELSEKETELTKRRDILAEAARLEANVALQRKDPKRARERFQEYLRWTSSGTPSETGRNLEVALLEAEGYPALALDKLESSLLSDSPDDKALRKQKLGLFEKLGWKEWADRERFRQTLDETEKGPWF